MSACHAANYRFFHDWQELSVEQRAEIVAHYFLDIVIKNNAQDAEITASEKRK